MGLLLEDEISAQANFPSLIEPLDNHDELIWGIDKCKAIVIVEESPKSFGWGSEIVSLLVENNLVSNKKVFRIGKDEHPIPSSAF